MSDQVTEAGGNPGFKTCTKCGETKSATSEHFHKFKSGKYGLNPVCKRCRTIYAKEHRSKNLEKARATWKVYREANLDTILAKGKSYYAANREKVLARQKVYYEVNTEIMNARSKAYYEANRDKEAALARVRYEADPERHKANHKKWREANPEKMLVYLRNRRALELAAEGKHTAADVFKQFDAQNGGCYWCGCKLIKSGKEKYHVDHREPLSKGGSNGPENIVCACPTCNLRKNAKTPLEFAGRLF